MDILKWEKDESIAVITMNKGENRHNALFTAGMLKIFDEILEDKSIYAVVINSSDEKNWSQGIDLGWLLSKKNEGDLQAIKDFLFSLNELFKKVLLFPMPVIAAINGHAFGNGAIFSCACDFRFMRADRGYFYFPEIDVSIPFMPGMIALLKKSIPLYRLEEMGFTGKKYTASELENFNIIQKACKDNDDLIKETINFAKSFKKKRGVFTEMKKRLHKEIISIIDTDDPPIIESLAIMVEE